ncbi:MAG: DUF167 domain-containing protein [Candidatus Heimdallarchaeota archaeon]|nr:DUF167 domain-containing protein [Candidatus Heimdallarchaeota archaeon]
MLKSYIKREGHDTLIILQVKTRQNINKLIFEDNRVIFHVKDPPLKGKANKTILKVLRKYFKTAITLESGHTSKNKIFRVHNLIPEQVQEILDVKRKNLEKK